MYLNSVLAILLDMHSLLVKIMLVLWKYTVCAVTINTGFIDYNLCYNTEERKN